MKLSIDSIIDLLTVFIYASLFLISSASFNGELISLASAIAAVILVLLNTTKTKGKIYLRLTAFHYWMIAFCVFCYLTAIWAMNANMAITKGNTIVKNTVLICLLMLYYSNQNNVKHLLKLMMYGGYIVVLFSTFYYGIDTLRMTINDTARIDNSFLNANILGMLASFTILINVYLIMYYMEEKKALVLAVFSFVIIAAAGSRKSIIELVLGILLIIIAKNSSNKKILRAIWRTALAVVIFLLIFFVLNKLSAFDFVNSRFENVIHYITGTGYLDKSVRTRAYLNTLGLEIFLKNPIIGVGMDNSRVVAMYATGIGWYLHNNFLELLVDGGILGFILYYSLHLFILSRFIKYRSIRDPEYDICFVLFILQWVLEYVYVSYYNRETFFYLMLFFCETEILRKRYEKRLIYETV